MTLLRLLRLATRALKRGYLEFKFLCWEINRKFRTSITVSTKQGVFTVLTTDEAIGRSLYCGGQFELDLMSKTMAFLRSIEQCPPKGEGTLVDIGANNGVISIGMLYTGELNKAIAIEPEPQNFTSLQCNVNQNGLEGNVLCLPYAAAHQKGEILFELSETNFGDHRVRTNSHVIDSTELYRESGRRVITVQADLLDHLLAELPESFTRDIAVIWIDVQGYEGYVFMGAKKLLSKGVPVMSEIWPYGIHRAGMTQEQFCDIARGIWTNYWVLRRGRFVRYPVHTLDILFDELGYGHGFENIIFTK